MKGRKMGEERGRNRREGEDEEWKGERGGRGGKKVGMNGGGGRKLEEVGKKDGSRKRERG